MAGCLAFGGEHRRQSLQEQRAVGQARQRVVAGLVAQPFLQRVPLGHVLHHRHREQRHAGVVANQRARHVRPHPAAVRPAQALLHPIVVELAPDHPFE
jgi:hypothetical protein